MERRIANHLWELEGCKTRWFRAYSSSIFSNTIAVVFSWAQNCVSVVKTQPSGVLLQEPGLASSADFCKSYTENATEGPSLCECCAFIDWHFISMQHSHTLLHGRHISTKSTHLAAAARVRSCSARVRQSRGCRHFEQYFLTTLSRFCPVPRKAV